MKSYETVDMLCLSKRYKGKEGIKVAIPVPRSNFPADLKSQEAKQKAEEFLESINQERRKGGSRSIRLEFIEFIEN